MDPLSLATSVAGLASLALQIGPSLREYFSDVRDARKDVARYCNEIDGLFEVCKQLQDFLRTDTADAFKTTESVLCRTVVLCEGCLCELAKLLDVPREEGHSAAHWIKRMKWPIYKKQVEGIISRLARYTQLFQFALTVEGCAVLSRTPEDVSVILKLQRDTSSKLHDVTKDIAALRVSAEEYRSTADKTASMLESVHFLTEPSQRLLNIQESVGRIGNQLTDRLDREILDWLSSEQAHGRHHEVRSRRTPGTGKWILNTPAFQTWMNNACPEQLLWIVGAPGCGKSTLVSLIIDELKGLQASNNAPIAYYYCDYRTQVTQPLTLALGHILRLLVERLSMLPGSLRELFESCHREGRGPSPLELEHLICDVLPCQSSYILVDAMDEFSVNDPAQTAQFTEVLDSFAVTGARVLVTSRTLPTPSLSASHIVETHTASNSDIRSFVAHELYADDLMVDILNNELEAEIMSTITEQSQGMFLLAVLYIRTIRGQISRSGIRKALSGLSGNLSDAYDKTFQAIKQQSGPRQLLALKTMMWVSSSHRPLRGIELRHALAARLEDKDLDFDNIPPLRLIVRSCCGLVSVNDLSNDDSEVRLVHHTLYQYLHSQREWMCHAHTVITQTCLSYLLFESLRIPRDRRSQPNEYPDEKYQFQPTENEGFVLTRFARDYWGYHANHSPLKSYKKLAVRLLTDNKRLQTLYPENKHIIGLHIAAAFGHNMLIDTLIKRGQDVNAKDSSLEIPLHKACIKNNNNTALFLIQRGARQNLMGFKCSTPLFIAVENKNLELTKLLIANGAIVNMPCKDCWTVLHKAADMGDLEIVKYLINNGSTTSETSTQGLTALHRAAGRGHLNVMQFLLEIEKTQIDPVTSDGWTPLHGAASSGQHGATLMLLRLGANIHHSSHDGWTPLHRSVQGGYPDTVQVLLSHGADVKRADRQGNLPLHIAAREGHVTIIHQLLERDLRQLSCSNLDGWTPLHEAQLTGSHAAESCLQRYGKLMSNADNTPETEDNTLVKALQSDDADTIEALINSSKHAEGLIGIEDRDSRGRTLLHRSLLVGSYGIASTLIANGADVHARSANGGWQAIHYAALSGNAQAVQLCLDRGADANCRTDFGKTPLHHACQNGNGETVQLLLDYTVDITRTDEQNWTPIHYVAAAGHRKALELILFSGKLNGKEIHWSNLQTCAAKRGHHELVEIFRNLRYSL